MKMHFETTVRDNELGFLFFCETGEDYFSLPAAPEEEKLPDGYKGDVQFIQIIREDDDFETGSIRFIYADRNGMHESLSVKPNEFVPREKGEWLIESLKLRKGKFEYYAEQERVAKERLREEQRLFLQEQMEFMRLYPTQNIEF